MKQGKLIALLFAVVGAMTLFWMAKLGIFENAADSIRETTGRKYSAQYRMMREHLKKWIDHKKSSFTKYTTTAPSGTLALSNHSDTTLAKPTGRYPNVTMMLRFASVERLKMQFYCLFLRTAVFFWPFETYGSLSVVLDGDSPADHTFGNKLNEQFQKNFPKINLEVHYEPLPKKQILNFQGSLRSPTYNRQLYSTFLADMYTTDEIIAYMDTDTQMVTPLTRRYIGFNNLPDGHTRLKVFAEGTFPSWVHSWNVSTFRALGLPMVANFMITFPQFVYRNTYTNCRHYILKHVGTTDFEEAFRHFYPPQVYLCPICIIMTYAWFYEHDRYDWHIKDRNAAAAHLNAALPTANRIYPKDMRPGIVGTAHISDHKSWQPQIMLPGYCMATKAAGMSLPGCEHISHDLGLLCEFWERQFRYTWPHAPSWCKAGTMRACCKQAMNRHYLDVSKMYKDQMLDFDKKNVYRVEMIAEEAGITCPHIELP